MKTTDLCLYLFTDRRTKFQKGLAAAMEQERQDQKIEKIWRDRVAQNVRARMSKKVIYLEDRKGGASC